ncbi:TPA: hypothetical protein DCR79_01315 [Patescibacteria group bacterium]|nr:hypothetical protein [Patescibacteria group bacterium]
MIATLELGKTKTHLLDGIEDIMEAINCLEETILQIEIDMEEGDGKVRLKERITEWKQRAYSHKEKIIDIEYEIDTLMYEENRREKDV